MVVGGFRSFLLLVTTDVRALVCNMMTQQIHARRHIPNKHHFMNYACELLIDKWRIMNTFVTKFRV